MGTFGTWNVLLNVCFYFLGIVLGIGIGFVLGLAHYKNQILNKKNPKVIEAVKSWIDAAEGKHG